MALLNFKNMRSFCLSLVFLYAIPTFAYAHEKEFYQVRTYILTSNEQIELTDQYLKEALLPALHRLHIKTVGVFKPIANDTASLKKVIVIIPFKNLDEWLSMQKSLNSDKEYISTSKFFYAASADAAPYKRMESTLLEAFPMHSILTVPQLKSPKTQRVYELRSYESPTEHLYERKVNMFNEGDEIGLFNQLNFNAVFYGSVISGCNMPNLMYMTSFESMEDRDAHWKSFGDSPFWKKISSDPVYENNVSVSHNDITLMHATDYSDL